MIDKEDGYWTEDVKIKYHPPSGTFTKEAKEVVDTLLVDAKGNAGTALHRLMFYINRAGSKIENSVQIQKAKTKLESIIKEEKDKHNEK